MSANVWISPRNSGSLRKPEKQVYDNLLDSSKLYGYEMSEGTALAIGVGCLSANVTVIVAFT